MTEETLHCREDQPEVAVAAACVLVIDELSRMIYDGFQHDEKSEKMVMGAMALLTSVLDGKAANPAYIGASFYHGTQAVEQSLYDEVSRCQHYLKETLEAKAMAEGRALVAEMYSRWYLRLRDGNAKDLEVVNPFVLYPEVKGEDLDIYMEDLDAAEGLQIEL